MLITPIRMSSPRIHKPKRVSTSFQASRAPPRRTAGRNASTHRWSRACSTSQKMASVSSVPFETEASATTVPTMDWRGKLAQMSSRIGVVLTSDHLAYP